MHEVIRLCHKHSPLVVAMGTCLYGANGIADGANQVAIRRTVEGEDGARLEVVRAHKVFRVLHHVHPLGVASIHPEPAPPQPTSCFGVPPSTSRDRYPGNV